MKDGKLVGLVAESDVLKALVDGRMQQDNSIAAIIEYGFATVSLDDSVSRLSDYMSDGKIPVLVDHGEVRAVITKIDLITYLGRKR
jgi:predicted transcriptional regulator